MCGFHACTHDVCGQCGHLSVDCSFPLKRDSSFSWCASPKPSCRVDGHTRAFTQSRRRQHSTERAGTHSQLTDPTGDDTARRQTAIEAGRLADRRARHYHSPLSAPLLHAPAGSTESLARPAPQTAGKRQKAEGSRSQQLLRSGKRATLPVSVCRACVPAVRIQRSAGPVCRQPQATGAASPSRFSRTTAPVWTRNDAQHLSESIAGLQTSGGRN